MAERRMFAKTIIDSDAFLDMPLSSQALYFHLSMRADDEGFINNPKKIQRMIGASEDDMKVLLAKNFLIAFESGVIVIKHWKIHNYIRADRLTQTAYQEERAMLELKDNGVYTISSDINEADSHMSDICQTSVSIGKDSIGKDSIGKDKDIGAEAPSTPKPKKHKYGECQKVLLTDEELQQLQIDYDEVAVKKAIRFLDEYIAEKGYKSKSHYLAIKRWVMDAVNERQKAGKDSKSDGQLDSLVEHLMEQM